VALREVRGPRTRKRNQAPWEKVKKISAANVNLKAVLNLDEA